MPRLQQLLQLRVLLFRQYGTRCVRGSACLFAHRVHLCTPCFTLFGCHLCALLLHLGASRRPLLGRQLLHFRAPRFALLRRELRPVGPLLHACTHGRCPLLLLRTDRFELRDMLGGQLECVAVLQHDSG